MNQTNCTAPRCSAPARWRVAGTDRTVCADHIPDSTPVEPLPLPGILAAVCPPGWLEPLPLPGILAAVCPPGWRRDPMTGRPVMPCLGKLLFPCAPDEVPTHLEVRRQLHQLFHYSDVRPCWVLLIGAILGDAQSAKVCDMPGLSQDTEKYLADCIDEVLRFRGTVRIVKTGAGWEEVGDDS